MSVFDNKRDKIKQFTKNTEGKAPSEVRDAEESLLKPEPVPKYTGELPKHVSELDSRTALIVFRNESQEELIGQLFSIRESVTHTKYITDISLLEGIARQVKEGTLIIEDHQIKMP